MKQYELYWKSIPMGALTRYLDWYCPCLGEGVYMFVLDTNQQNVHTAFYVGKSQDIGNRWHTHLNHLFLNPNDNVWCPQSAEDFLNNPVAVFNQNALTQGLPDRKQIQGEILSKTWFCFTEINCFNSGDRLENVENVLQEALKIHAGIEAQRYIGDDGVRYAPQNDMTIHNHFCREFLQRTLPTTIRYDQQDGNVDIND